MSLEVTEHQRRAINHYFGKNTPATQESIKAYLALVIDNTLVRLEDDLNRDTEIENTREES